MRRGRVPVELGLRGLREYHADSRSVGFGFAVGDVSGLKEMESVKGERKMGNDMDIPFCLLAANLSPDFELH